MADCSPWVTGVGGDFPIHTSLLHVLPKGSTILSAHSTGVSSWTRIAKVTVLLPGGDTKRYFLKCATGRSARAIVEGEYHSAVAISSRVADFTPKPTGWSQYHDSTSEVFFLLTDFREMELSIRIDPDVFITQVVKLHSRGVSPTGMFGFPVPTVCGRMERTVRWESSWSVSFTHQLMDVIKYDNEANGPWPEFDAACSQLLDMVIPRLLGVLQTDGRSITPTLIHGDLWENNIGLDKETGNIIVFDAGSTYAHNEMEFGTWRCWWATHFRDPIYMQLYQSRIDVSEPKEEWDDRNRLYSIHPYLNDSAGHTGSISRRIAYNDMLYLCEKYSPLETLEKYNPELDVKVTNKYAVFDVKQLEQ